MLGDNQPVPASLRTPICDLLGVRYPILNAGIGPAAGPELAAAVTNAGGFGVLGGGGMPIEAVRKRVVQTRARTSGPFGFNIIIDDPATPDDLQHVEALAETGVAAIVLFWGDSTPYVERIHRHGAKVLVQVGSLDEALRAAKSGADAVIALRLQKERQHAGLLPSIREYAKTWGLSEARVRLMRPEAPVLHPGPMNEGVEIAASVAHGARSLIETQVTNGVAVRMALLYLLAGTAATE